MATNGQITDSPAPPEKPKKKKQRVRKRHRLAITTATIRSDINVTPLVDVVLVLLIIFMVVTPMITRGMPVEMPKTKHHDSKSDSGEQIVVSITCNSPRMGVDRMECGGFSVFVATERADGDSIGEKLKQEMRKSPGREVHIKADKRLNYGPVRETMERINAAGIAAVALGSEELKEK